MRIPWTVAQARIHFLVAMASIRWLADSETTCSRAMNNTLRIFCWGGGGTDTLRLNGFQFETLILDANASIEILDFNEFGLIGTDNNNFFDVSGVTEFTNPIPDGPGDFIGGAFFALRGGNNTFIGGFLGENVISGNGNDLLLGGGGNDTLESGAGADTVDGGAGDDVFVASYGYQEHVYRGGSGTDTFRTHGGSFVTLILDAAASVEILDIFYQSTLSGTSFDDYFDLSGITTYTGSNTINARSGNDTIIGSDVAEHIFGDNGADSLFGAGGDDTLTGGDGADTVDGGAGNDLLIEDSSVFGDIFLGGDGMDTLRLEIGSFRYLNLNAAASIEILDLSRNNIEGGAESDYFDISGVGQVIGGQNRVELFSGDDTFIGGNLTAYIYGGTGDDSIVGGSEYDLLDGGDGNDTLFGMDGIDDLVGGGQHDAMFGGGGNDRLWGEGGRDSLRGGTGDDTIWGGWYNDWLYGEAGDDSLNGDGGHDRLFGGWGNDILIGGNGGDTLFGAGQDDTLFGDAGHDKLFGEAGNDSLSGGGLRDTLDGGIGNDTLTGGWFSDTFVFADGFGRDVITDFDPNNLNERIDLSGVTGITDLNDLITNHMAQIGTNVVITDGSHTITIEGVSLASMSDGNDFLF